MAHIPYLSINIISFGSFVLIFTAFLAAKKTPEIRAFMALIGDFIIWSGASVLMRLQIFPGLSFWFYVSIFALFAIAFLCYRFVCTFVRAKTYFMTVLFAVMTVIILVLTAFGIFLEPPAVDIRADGSTVFLYTMKWPIVIPLILLLTIVFFTARILRGEVQRKGLLVPGLRAVITGCCIMALGNMTQIIPGNIIPWDTLSGIAFSIFMVWAMYKKHMFRMTLVISRSLLMLLMGLICVCVATFFAEPMQTYLISFLNISMSTATTCIVVLLSVLLALSYSLLKRLIDVIFTRDEQQSKILNSFSSCVSRSLNTGDVMGQLVSVIQEVIDVEQIYICLPENEKFVVKYSSNALAPGSFSISKDNPCISYLMEQESYLLMDDFRGLPMFLSIWDNEKALFQEIDLGCMLALRDRDTIVGLVLLSGKGHGGKFGYLELDFLTTVSSIASIAVKNAGLYEQVYREARIDSLTGVYNYRYFVESIEKEFERCRSTSLALIYIDVDDFKLYNQLYGTQEGDNALCLISGILTGYLGERGKIFRSSGKVFAVLVPGCDSHQAEIIATNISMQVAALNKDSERSYMKPISISCGICVSPYNASTAKELMENADLAVYNAKNTGKNTVSMFHSASPSAQSVSARTHEIITTYEQSADAARLANASTIAALTAAIDAKDHYTYRHSRNVANYAAILSTAYNLSPEQVCMIYEAGLLHDIGKISIPENILSKRGPLTRDEFLTMRNHVNNSIEMIRHLSSMDYLIPAVVGHHERWDGKGYPRGISHGEIPISARCLAIADAFDAMTTDRPYRKGMSIEYAISQIESGSGKQFDPVLAPLFVALIREGEISLNSTKIE